MRESTQSSFPEAMQWHKHIEWIHRSVKPWVPNPKERTEKGYYECIAGRKDIREMVTSWLSWTEKNVEGPLKNDDEARRLREEGNGFFKKMDYRTALERYTESAKYATRRNDDFSLAVANRSAAFCRIRRYKESLEDIETALAAGYPKDKAKKLEARAIECRVALGIDPSSEEGADASGSTKHENGEVAPSTRNVASKLRATRGSSEMEDDRSFRPDRLLPKNEKFRFASTRLARRTSPTRGRYVVAEKDLKKGEVIFVEKPFAWVPVTHGNDASLCAHCCGCLEDFPHPCDGCMDALYCSSTCWRVARDTHLWECAGYRFALWQQIGISHLAFKIFVASIATSDDAWFTDVQKLVTNVDKRSIDDIIGIGIASLMVTTYLERCTNFFRLVNMNECHVKKLRDPSLSMTENVDLSTIAGKRLYVGAMIFRHSLQMLANAYAVTRIGESLTQPGEEQPLLIAEQQRVATGAYPSASELNHSCDPTVINTFWKNWLIVKVLKNVAAGDEIFNCYGPYYRRMPKSTRRTDLLNQYCFHCECHICRDPRFDNYKERFNGLKCPKCSGSSSRLAVPLTDLHRCYDCGAESQFTFHHLLEKAAELSDRGMDLTDRGEWEAAIPCFEEALLIQQKYLYRHNEDIAITRDALGKCHASNGRWRVALEYLEKSLAAVEKRYGSDSIEVANELNKLTDVCFQYLIEQPKRKMEEHRETFMKTRKYVDRALEIMDLTSGAWDPSYQQIAEKKERLTRIMEQVRL